MPRWCLCPKLYGSSKRLMLAQMIVAVIPLSIQPLNPVLVSESFQFAFAAHALQRLTPLQQYLLFRDEYHCDTHNALTMPLLHSLARPPCGFEADCHGLPHCIERIALWVIWHLTMKTLIVSIAIGDSYNHVHCNRQCRRLMSLVATAHSSDTHVALAAMLFTRLLN